MLEDLGRRAKAAAKALQNSTNEQRDQALEFIALALQSQEDTLLQANLMDMQAGQALSKALQDRLRLTPARLQDIAQAVREVKALPDPIHQLLWHSTRPNGLRISRVSVPLGVIAVIYEARPNVTLDAAAMCLKSGNAVILRGGKEAIHSNKALVSMLRSACLASGLPEDCAQLVEDTSRDSALALMHLSAYVDLLIPRGGQGLIRSALENAAMPVLETGEGVCHIYVDKAADIPMACAVAVNAKCSRPSTCNAAECLLVHQDIAHEALPLIAQALLDKGVILRGDAASCQLIAQATPASADDWGREFNDLIMAVRVVTSLDEALEHIERYGTKHSEAIITQDEAARARFFDSVDAAAVYHNASTRFTDGGEFGFGAEIGIATQKLHCRGPVGVSNLTTYKYLIRGEGQTR